MKKNVDEEKVITRRLFCFSSIRIAGIIAFLVFGANLAAQESFVVSGTVTDDPYPSKMMSKPLSGCKVYIQEQLFYAQEGADSGLVIMPPYVNAYDSAVTGADGLFEFKKTGGGNWNIRFTLKGYVTRSVNINLTTDTVMTIAMLKEGASATVSGYVSRRHDDPQMSSVIPIAGCTVSVYTESEYGVYYMEATNPRENSIVSPIIMPVFTAVTDEQGFYSVQDIPLVYNGVSASVWIHSGKYAAETKTVQLYNTSTSTVSFDMQNSFSNRDSVIFDGVVYSVVTEKSRYARGEYLYVKYFVENQSSKTVTFQNSGPGQNLCTYALVLKEGESKEIFSTNNGLMCPLLIRHWELAPGEMDSMVFDPYLLDGDYTLLSVSALMSNDLKTQASVNVEVSDETAIFSTLRKQDFTESSLLRQGKGNSVILEISHPGQVSVTAYRPDGRLIGILANWQSLNAGRHEFILDRKLSASGTIIVRASGSDFSITKKMSIP